MTSGGYQPDSSSVLSVHDAVPIRRSPMPVRVSSRSARYGQPVAKGSGPFAAFTGAVTGHAKPNGAEPSAPPKRDEEIIGHGGVALNRGRILEHDGLDLAFTGIATLVKFGVTLLVLRGDFENVVHRG